MEENNNVEVLNQPQPVQQPVQQPIQEPVQQPAQPPVQPTPVTPAKPSIPEEYTPMTIGGYIGYTLLFGIPCIGFIVALVIAFGGNKKISLKNYAKAYLIMILIAVVLIVIMAVAAGSIFWSIFNTIAESSNYGLGA